MNQALAESLASPSVSGTSTSSYSSKPSRKRKGKEKEKEKFGQVKPPSNQAQGDHQPKRNPANPPGARLRGLDRDTPDVRISKTLSWLLRHGAQSEGLQIRTDGYIKVDDLVRCSLVSFLLVYQTCPF
jgi:2'-phosphotransferase